MQVTSPDGGETQISGDMILIATCSFPYNPPELSVDGKLVYDLPALEEIRQRRIQDVESLDPGIRRLVNPHIYHVSLSQELWNLKQEMIAQATGAMK